MNVRKLLFASGVLSLALMGCGPSEGNTETEAKSSPLLQTPLKEQSAPVQAMGPAPALSYLQVYAVISSNYPSYEYVGQNQYTTLQDHGGAEMYVVTLEYGYGTSRFARMNGGALLQEYTDSTHPQPIVDASNNITGWYRWWIASGYDSGQFTYQSTSINSPFNTMSDFINIK